MKDVIMLSTEHKMATKPPIRAILSNSGRVMSVTEVLYLTLLTKRNGIPRHSVLMTISSTVQRIGVCFAVCIWLM